MRQGRLVIDFDLADLPLDYFATWSIRQFRPRNRGIAWET